VKRRDFIALLGGAAAWPSSATAQQSAMPVVGFLSSRTAQQAEYLLPSLRAGLKESGYVEGQNVTIDYRYANNRNDLLPGLAAELVARQVAVIVAGGTSRPAIAATRTIPIVFTTGFDPVAAGLVSSLNKPDANVTGATFYSGALGSKQVEILTELAPRTATIGLLVNPNLINAATQIQSLRSAAASVGRELVVLSAGSEPEFASAFAELMKRPNPGLIVSVDPLFDSHGDRLIALAEQHALPTVYYLRDFAKAGGLVSYGASILDAYRQAGVYAGRILKGVKPADLPVQLPTRFELVVNLKTARAFGLTIPATVLATADEVIE
jgi:putative tryptophan/tyrosine transport system substrate-binding protein